MRSARAAITLVFFADGLLIGSWAARIPAVQRQTELTSGKLGIALFAMSLGALLAMPTAGRLSERIGSRSVTLAALLAGGAALLLTAVAGGLAGLGAALFLFGAGFGAVNVAANAQGIALERLSERSILSSFHAAFSFGGLAGAGLGAIAAAAGIDPLEHFGAIAVAIALSALAAGGRLLPPDADDRETTPILARPQRSLLVLGAAAFFTLMAEGAAADWSAVYLSDSLGAGAAAAALGYTAFSLAMAASRVFGDRLNTRLGPVALARGGGLLAASALTLALVSGSTVVALAGFAAMGAGLGVVVPVLFRAAGSTPGVSAAAGVAAVSTIGWFGFLAGPPAIGVTADAVGLRSSLVIVVAATLGLALLAGSANPRRKFHGLLFQPGAVLSDMDGVLVDSWTAIKRTWTRFAHRHGLDPEVVLAASHGVPTIDVIRTVAPHLDASAEAAAVEREQIEEVEGLRPLPGARELVASLPAGRFAVVTSASRKLAESRLRAAGLPVPDVLVSSDDVEHGKPSPAGYLRAACLLGVDPAHSVVLEDAPAGVEAGVAAGMTVIGVLTTNPASALREAHSRVPDLAALLA
ncbi:MAG: ybjJ [Gaiellaceae bacterium]|nr:ybjJ [Gaiellaceae bacterium]